jgi:hypothetical protein
MQAKRRARGGEPRTLRLLTDDSSSVPLQDDARLLNSAANVLDAVVEDRYELDDDLADALTTLLDRVERDVRLAAV